jgi:biopolymer transport protein ExbB/TolQ
MVAQEFARGGPLMLLVFACWVVVLALVMDRVLFWLSVLLSRPLARMRRESNQGRITSHEIEREVRELLEGSRQNLGRIDSFSQIATSVGLFGTVVGIARSFLAKGGGEVLAAGDALMTGLSTALYTTIGGLVVFLFGQVALVAFETLTEVLARSARPLGAHSGEAGG